MRRVIVALLIIGVLAGCCGFRPYQRLYILAEKVLKKKEIVSVKDEELSMKDEKNDDG